MDSRWQQPTTQEKTVLVKNLLIPLAKKIKENAYAFKCALKKEMFEDFKYMEKIKEYECLENELSIQKENVSKEVYNPTISLIQEEGMTWFQEDAKIQEKNSADTEILQQEEEPTELVENPGSGKKGEKEVSTIGAEHSTVIPEVSTTVANLVYIRRSAEKRKDKGKAIIKEGKSVQKKTKKQLEQERLSHETSIRLQEQIDEEERKSIAREAEIAKQLQEEFDKARQEQKVVAKDNQARVINWSSKKKQSRKKSLTRKRAGEKQGEESTKRQKIEDDIEKGELKAYLDLVPREEFAMEIESLATKYPIVDWKTYVLIENFMYYQIIRADRGSKNYKIFSEMLDDFKRQDVMDLHRLVEERYATSRPEGYDLIL
ncbi:hypothetical protein Tco_0869034 [Tanacetum coccineum]